MWKWIKQLDGILRGDATRLSELRDGRIDMPVGGGVDPCGHFSGSLWHLHGVIWCNPYCGGRRDIR